MDRPYSGFISVADRIDGERFALKAQLDAVRQEAYRSVAQVDLVQDGLDPIDRHFDHRFTMWLRAYWRSEDYRKFLQVVFTTEPMIFELIDAPAFAHWQRELSK